MTSKLNPQEKSLRCTVPESVHRAFFALAVERGTTLQDYLATIVTQVAEGVITITTGV